MGDPASIFAPATPSGQLNTNTMTANVVSAMDIENMSIYEIAPMVQLYGRPTAQNNNLPLWTAQNNLVNLGGQNRFSLSNSTTTALEVSLVFVKTPEQDLLDFRMTNTPVEIVTTPDGLEVLTSPTVVPKGENVRVYEASINPLVVATANLLYSVFDLKPII